MNKGILILSSAVGVFSVALSGQALNETFKTAPVYTNNWQLAFNHSSTITYTAGNFRIQAPQTPYPPGGGAIFLSNQIFTGDVDVSFQLDHQGYGQTKVGLFSTASGVTQIFNFDLDTDDEPCLFMNAPSLPQAIAHCPSSQYLNRWVTLRIQLQGSIANFYADGNLLQTVSSPNPPGSYRIGFGASSVPWKSGANDTSFRVITGVSSLMFPIQGREPYTTDISSVADHNRTPGIIVSYAGERGRRVDGVLLEQGTLEGFSGYTAGPSMPKPLFLVNGTYNDNHIFYEKPGLGTFIYQHPGYDYPVTGIVVAPVHGTLWIVASDPINGSHGTNSAWCGFHTFKLVHDDGAHQSWFLHTLRFLNAGQSGAIQNLDTMARAAIGPDVYDCKKGTAIQKDKMFATVQAGEALAIIGDTGVVPHVHLHHEERNPSNCVSDGSNCLMDPFGWEGANTAVDPLQSNPGVLLWEGYVRPSINSAVIASKTGVLDITGTNLIQAGGATSIEVWRKLDESLTGNNPNDGIRLMSLTVQPGASATEIKGILPPTIVSSVSLYTIKVAIQNGPRSVALVPAIQ